LKGESQKAVSIHATEKKKSKKRPQGKGKNSSRKDMSTRGIRKKPRRGLIREKKCSTKSDGKKCLKKKKKRGRGRMGSAKGRGKKVAEKKGSLLREKKWPNR